MKKLFSQPNKISCAQKNISKLFQTTICTEDVYLIVGTAFKNLRNLQIACIFLY